MSGYCKFIAGAVVGAITTALFTPMSGEELRSRIKEALRRKGLVADERLDEVTEMIAAELSEK